jgi:hypothetical protein
MTPRVWKKDSKNQSITFKQVRLLCSGTKIGSIKLNTINNQFILLVFTKDVSSQEGNLNTSQALNLLLAIWTITQTISKLAMKWKPLMLNTRLGKQRALTTIFTLISTILYLTTLSYRITLLSLIDRPPVFSIICQKLEAYLTFYSDSCSPSLVPLPPQDYMLFYPIDFTTFQKILRRLLSV